MALIVLWRVWFVKRLMLKHSSFPADKKLSVEFFNRALYTIIAETDFSFSYNGLYLFIYLFYP